MYDDKKLKTAGFPGEGTQTGKVVAIKTHDYGPTCKPNYDRAIVLIRHPRETMLSEFNRQASFGDHTGKAHPSLFLHPGEM